jgi:Zn-dependent membrane protease YugP
MLFFDMRYIIVMLPVMILTLWAQWRLRSVYGKYSQVRNQQGRTGAQAARILLDSQGLSFVPIQELPGAAALSNHYDPSDRTLHLSPEVYRSDSVAALGIAAHECGHAVQHAQNYMPMQARTALVPATNIGSNVGVWMVMIGFFGVAWFHMTGLIWLVWAGVALFGLASVFALLTLPVELNASTRAMTLLQSTGLIDRTEYGEARSVLTAAAWTYVAGLAAAVMNLLYYVMLASGLSRGRR